MKYRLLVVLVVVASLLLQPVSSSLANHPSPPPDTISPGNNYSVNYTNNNPPPTVDANYFTTAQAQRVANALTNGNAAATGNPNGYHNGYIGLGFSAPSFGGTGNVNIFDCSQHGGCDMSNAPANRIQMPAPAYLASAETCLRLVVGHELFHHVQYAYINFSNWSAWGTAPVEGGARVMQDKVYSDLDANSGCITYKGATGDWLNTPNQNLWNSSYTFALFWNYLMEQLGTTATEPQVGVDFMQRFWQTAQTATNNGTIDFPNALRTTITSFSTARTLEQIYHDFAIANYTKLMDVSALPNSSRYKYKDENEAAGDVYTNVVRAINTPLDFGGVSGNVSVSRWGTEYYVVRPAGRCIDGKSNVVGFVADGDVMNWALVSTKGAESVQRIDRGTQGHFARSLLQRTASPYTELAAVAANTGNAAANVTVKFACGEASVQILDPLTTRPAYVGEKGAPDRFVLRVLATGPITLGTPSIEGLLPSDFEVFVGSVITANQATIVSGAQVQGEYWLVVQPPTKGVADAIKQNLTVRLNTATDTEQEAVIYQKQILDQMLVIDKSNSMNFPIGTPKIAAAKNAARLFVDAARISDTLGIVSFKGSNEEVTVVDDAVLDMSLTAVTAASRVTATTKINGIAAGGWTSIGDGVDKARPQFASGGPGEDWIVLLSDGMENEAKYWSSVSNAITTAGIRVNTIALGPTTDQALLQQIANQTGGTYYYVDSGTYGARPAGDAAIDATVNTTSNSLADAYALANERQRRHQRVGEWWSTVNGSVYSTTFKIDAGGLKDALFNLNWPDGVGTLTVTLRRPDGTLVQNGVGGVKINAQSTHIVVNMDSVVGGVWILNVSGGTGAVPFVALFSGIPKNGVESRVWLAEPTLSVGPLRGLYLRGLPMPILASLSDSAGPIRRAKVMANVKHPSGFSTKLPLFDDGNHGDGAAADGVFGNLYALTTVSSPRSNGDVLTPVITTTALNGSYLVEMRIEGEDSAGNSFVRIPKTAFQIYEYADRDKEWMQSTVVDTDRDGMPDRYERLHSCLNPNVAESANHDPDRDGLNSYDEWLKYGTDPCNSDTDGGGDSDGGEGTMSPNPRNPLDPSDDELTRPIDPEVVNWVSDHLPDPPVASNANLIRYPANPKYKSIRMYRTDSVSPGIWTTIVFSSTTYSGIYTNTGLVNGRTYTYALQGIGNSGVASAMSPFFVGVPKADPLPPRGGVDIFGGRLRISNRVTRVMLEADPDTTQYMISNNPALTGATWLPFTHTLPLSLTLNITHTLGTTNGVAVVYVKFRDAAGNVSARYSDDVVVNPPAVFGVIRGTASLLRPAARSEVSAEGGESTEFDSVASVEEGPLELVPEMFIAEEPASESASDALAVEKSAPQPVLEPVVEPAAPEESTPLAIMPEVATPQTDAHDHAHDAVGSHEDEPAVAQRESATVVRSPAGTFVWCANIPDATPVLATADGKFELTDVPPGRCLLRVLQEGFRPRSMFVDVAAGRVVTVSNKVELSPRSSGLPSSDALLRSLSLSSSVFGRTFVSTTFNYTATNNSTSLSLKVVATAHPSATMLYESSAGTCSSNECPLTSSRTILTVSVAADDGITDRRYTVIVQKLVIALMSTPKPASVLLSADPSATVTITSTALPVTATPTVDAVISVTPTPDGTANETPVPTLTETVTITATVTLPPIELTPNLSALAGTSAPITVTIYLPFLQR